MGKLKKKHFTCLNSALNEQKTFAQFNEHSLSFKLCSTTITSCDENIPLIKSFYQDF